jgi:hypothetical protein
MAGNRYGFASDVASHLWSSLVASGKKAYLWALRKPGFASFRLGAAVKVFLARLNCEPISGA